MLPTFIAIIIICTVIFIRIISIQHRLVSLDENINNMMTQIGVQLSCRFDALTVLIELTRDYEKQEGESMMEILKTKRSVITPKSTPEDVLKQEGIIIEVLNRIALITEKYPELKIEPIYIKSMDAIEIFDNMVRTSRLVYNDGVSKLNRELRMFPIPIIASIFGFKKREYLVDYISKVEK